MRLSNEYNAKLKSIKDYLYAIIKRSVAGEASSKKRKYDEIGFDYQEFCRLMTNVGLDKLATINVFNIFDVDGNGSIDIKEFLTALIALRLRQNDEEEEETAELYFALFDVNGDGQICREELVSNV